LVFDSTNVKNHESTYTTLLHIQTKEKLFLLAPLQCEIFYVHQRVHVEMNILETIATWIPLILQLKT